MKFEDFKLDHRLIQALEYHEIVEPTTIQREAIPPALEKADILGVAPTGSGKTFAFLLPSLHWLLNAQIPHNDPSVLIMVPTRELVKQMAKVVKELGRYTDFNTVSVFSGPREGQQKRAIEAAEFIDVVIATPGRLLNFLEEDILDLSQLSIVIVDEVDTLLDMGFLGDVNKILDYIPHKNARQTMLFGASLPKEVEGLAMALQKRGKLVDVGRSTPPETITHGIFEAQEDEKYDVLLELLHKEEIEKVIIFTQSKHEARITARNLRRDGLDVEEIHAGLTQRQRNHAIANFISDEVLCLVASDVAARGLDIMDVSHIISYDVPGDFNMYVHRAGRTGRAFRKGTSWIIASPKEFGNLANIDAKLGTKVPRLRTLRVKEKRIDPAKRQPPAQNSRKYRK